MLTRGGKKKKRKKKCFSNNVQLEERKKNEEAAAAIVFKFCPFLFHVHLWTKSLNNKANPKASTTQSKQNTF